MSIVKINQKSYATNILNFKSLCQLFFSYHAKFKIWFIILRGKNIQNLKFINESFLQLQC